MIQNKFPPMVLMIALLISGAGWIFLSAHDVQQSFENEVSLHLERARRILHQHSAELAYQSLLVEQIQNLDVDLVDADELSEDALDEYQEIHTQLWEGFQPMDWSDRPRSAQAKYNNLSRQITHGRNDRKNLIRNNQKLLNQALSAVEDALAISVGDESGRTHAEANRLKGIIQYHLGLSHHISASLKRVEAVPYQRRLMQAINRINAAQPEKSIVADSHIDEQIRPLEENIRQTRTDLNRQRGELENLDRTIRDLKSRITQAINRRDAARKQMDDLKSEGLDFSDPDGAQTFANRLRKQDRIYRDADREARSLEAGRYPHAQIGAGGDYLRDRYVENGSIHNLTIEHGLNHYQNERWIVTARIEGLQRVLDHLLDDTTSLETIKDGYAMAQIDAVKRTNNAQNAASEAWDVIREIDTDAFEIEETALDLLNKSAKTSQQAARYAGDWINNARDKTRGLSPQAREYSAYQKRTNDAWMGGHMNAQSADARIVMAWIQYERFLTYTQNARILSALPESVRLEDADVENELASATEARDAGVELIQQISKTLEKAHRDTGQHWTLVAQQADATYVLALFGDRSYVDDAIEGYRNAIKGREDKAYVQRIVNRLHRLEKYR